MQTSRKWVWFKKKNHINVSMAKLEESRMLLALL